MKLLYLAFVRLPTEKAHGAQIMKTCEAFANADVDVELVVPGRRTRIAEDPFAYYGVRKNFTLTTLRTSDWVMWGSIGFAASALLFSEAAKWQTSFRSADVIYSRDAFVLMQYLLLGKRLVYEAHTKPTMISTLVAKRASRLVVISEGLRDAYLARGVSPDRIIVAHDAIDPEPFARRYDKQESRTWLGIPAARKVALYVGRIDAGKGADVFAAASEHVPDDVLCVCIGSGPLKSELQKRYPKVLFLPETTYRELPHALAAADILVLPNSSKDEDAARYTSPLKAFAYLATDRPLVASDVPALRAICKTDATYFSADDPIALADALTQVEGVTRVSRIHSWRDRASVILDALA